MDIPYYINDVGQLKKYIRNICKINSIVYRSPSYYNLKYQAINSFNRRNSILVGGSYDSEYIVKTTNKFGDFCTALIADQIHDFLKKDDRSSLIQISGISSVDSILQVWEKCGIKLGNVSPAVAGKTTTLNEKILGIAIKDGKERQSQRVAEEIIEDMMIRKKQINPIHDFHALSVLISKQVNTAAKDHAIPFKSLYVDDSEESELKYQSTSEEIMPKARARGERVTLAAIHNQCSPFIKNQDLLVRSLLPEEFNCFKSLLVAYGKSKMTSEDISNINIIVDATKERDTSITNTLISESGPNELCRRYRKRQCHIGSPNIVIHQILPNDFDKAKEDALFSFQRDLSNTFIHSDESNIQFKIHPCREDGILYQTDNIMKWNLVRLPNALQILFDLKNYSIDFLCFELEEAVKKDVFLSELESKYPDFAKELYRSIQDVSKDDQLDYKVKNPSGETFWCDLFEGTNEPQVNRMALYDLIDILPELEGVNSFRDTFKLSGRFTNDKLREGIKFYNEQISILHKLRHLKNDLRSLFEKIRVYFKSQCNFDWKTVNNLFQSWLRVKININKGKLDAGLFKKLDEFYSDNKSFGKDTFFNFEVETEDELTSACTFAQLSLKWWFYLWFLYEVFQLRPDVLDNLITQRVVCTQFTIQKINFDSHMMRVNTYLSNIEGFGPSVNNVGTFLEEIRYLFLEEFTCTAAMNNLLEIENWVTIIRKRGTSDYTIRLAQIGGVGAPVEFKINQQTIVDLFLYGYLASIEFDDAVTNADGSEQDFPEEEKFDETLDTNPDLAKYYFLGMMNKTLCDLSISSWCAGKNSDETNLTTNYLFLTFDRIAACISTMLYGMQPFTLLQKDKALFVPYNNPLFVNEHLADTDDYRQGCLLLE